MGASRGDAHCGCDDGAGGEGSQSALKRSQSVTIVSAASRLAASGRARLTRAIGDDCREHQAIEIRPQRRGAILP